MQEAGGIRTHVTHSRGGLSGHLRHSRWRVGGAREAPRPRIPLKANRVGVTGWRPSPLPHHPACRQFPRNSPMAMPFIPGAPAFALTVSQARFMFTESGTRSIHVSGSVGTSPLLPGCARPPGCTAGRLSPLRSGSRRGALKHPLAGRRPWAAPTPRGRSLPLSRSGLLDAFLPGMKIAIVGNFLDPGREARFPAIRFWRGCRRWRKRWRRRCSRR